MCWARHQKLRAAQRDGQGHHPIPCTVRLAGDDHAPDHDWHHLEALSQHLHRKRDILQCLVLARAGIDIGKGHDEVFPQGGLVLHGLALRDRHGDCESHRCQAIAQNEEDGISEKGAIVSYRHDALLENPVDNQGADNPNTVEHTPRGRGRAWTLCHRHARHCFASQVVIRKEDRVTLGQA